MFECEADGDELFPDPHVDHAVIVDLLRRSGRFDEAVALAEEDLEEAEGDVAAILAFSRALALARDADAHSVDDIATTGTDDRSIVEALKQLEACRERGEYHERFVVLNADAPPPLLRPVRRRRGRAVLRGRPQQVPGGRARVHR